MTAPTAAASPQSTRTDTAAARRDLLRRYLNVFWLRPENAFWTVLRSLAWQREPLRGPALDLSCGDGVFSFIHAGGEFDESFDVFRAVGNLERVTREAADMFDAAPDTGFAPRITRRPSATIDIGTDLKATMLRKATALRFYSRLIEHDNNQPLPLPDGHFETIYCNSAKWVRNIAGFLREIRRIARPGATIILHNKLDTIRDYTLTRFEPRLGRPLLELLDRGRLSTWPSLASHPEWERRFEAAGLELRDITPIATRTHAHLWDIGLRPIAPLLVRMTAALDEQTRASIKREWVELFMTILEPICRPELELFGRESEPAEVQYVLTPASD